MSMQQQLSLGKLPLYLWADPGSVSPCWRVAEEASALIAVTEWGLLIGASSISFTCACSTSAP